MRLLALLISYSSSCIWAATPSTWRGASDIKFAGTSTLHSWSGTVSAEPFVATVVMNEQGRPQALTAKVHVKVLNMDTSEEKRDAKMRASMKAVDFPLVTANMDCGFEKVMKPGEATPSRLPFKLTLLGKEQPVIADITNWSLKGNLATFDINFDLSLKACGIEVPSVAYVIRVGDTIKLHASVKLTRA